jgi:hypothetical protein
VDWHKLNNKKAAFCLDPNNSTSLKQYENNLNMKVGLVEVKFQRSYHIHGKLLLKKLLHEDGRLPRCSAVYSGRSLPMFCRHVLPLSSRLWLGACCVHRHGLITEAASTRETLVQFYHTARRNIPEDSHLHYFCRDYVMPL